MTIDLTQLITNLQADIDAVDSDTSMDQILKYVHRARSLTEINSVYDSVGVMPTDSAYDGMLAFSKSDNTMYKFVDSSIDGGTIFAWHQADSAFSSGGSVGQNLQGTTSGYAVGGYTSTNVNTIDKYSYASNQNATDVGDMVVAHSVTEMTSSPTHTYLHAGYAPPGNMATLEKFSLTSDGNSALVPGVTTPTERGSSTHNGPGFGYQIYNSKIHKINHTSDTFSADAGSIPSPVETSPVTKVQSYTNTTHAYSGNYSPAPTDPFVKTAFASDTASASSAQADQTYGDQAVAACFNSDVAGYAAGGNTTTPTNAITAITKFVFASEAEMTSVGTMSFAPAGQRDYGGTASTTHGYAAGGRSYTAPNSVATTENTIHNTPFASDAPSSDVGDLTQARYSLHHVQAQV